MFYGGYAFFKVKIIFIRKLYIFFKEKRIIKFIKFEVK